jgi:hypothetical protein
MAVTVVFDLVEPVGAVRDFLPAARDARFNGDFSMSA